MMIITIPQPGLAEGDVEAQGKESTSNNEQEETSDNKDSSNSTTEDIINNIQEKGAGDDGLGITSDGKIETQEVTIEDAGTWFIDKVLELSYFLQGIAAPLAIAFIIIGFFILMFSIFNLKMMWLGITIIILQIVAFVGIMYAPIILEFFYFWLQG